MIKGRILYDVTKARKQRQKSGIARVSSCLNKELKALLGDQLVEVVWDDRSRAIKPKGIFDDWRVESRDVFLTCELFCESEREGIESFIKEFPGLTYGIFHDAIPLQYPEFTWPHSVQRHPSYMKMLAMFSGIFAVSSHSAMQLEEYWEWLELQRSPSVRSIQLGCDGVFDDWRSPSREIGDPPRILTLAILEKRKGQDIAIEAAKSLWDEGIRFHYDFVGRTNPYFGKDIERLLKQTAKRGYSVAVHGQLVDAQLQKVFDLADLVLLPSLAEGCGLPLLESLWRGIPTLSSSLHSVRENARFCGCRLFKRGDCEDLARSLRNLIEKPSELADLKSSIRSDELPRWKSTAVDIVEHLVTDGA